MLLGAALLVACGGGRVKASTPDGEPGAPAGEGWFCFHAGKPVAGTYLDPSTGCERLSSRCARRRERLLGQTLRLELPPPPIPRPEPPRAYGDSPPLLELCAIDPRSCAAVSTVQSWTVTDLDACAPKKVAYCAPYYHEFNHWRPGRPKWAYSCYEDEQDCTLFRDQWLLHVATRACRPIE
ncbi:MAG: hypothetical protein U0271_03810 [Polyangiaceae bacterium]